nr:MAG TPA_asm: hypothetical protein [Caudoviricetes sp.]
MRPQNKQLKALENFLLFRGVAKVGGLVHNAVHRFGGNEINYLRIR